MGTPLLKAASGPNISSRVSPPNMSVGDRISAVSVESAPGPMLENDLNMICCTMEAWIWISLTTNSPIISFVQAQMVPNHFRMKFLYKGGVDEVFRVYHKFISATFVTSNYTNREMETAKSRKFVSDSERALKYNRLKRRSSVSTTKQQWMKAAIPLQPAVPGRMDLEHWFKFLSTAGLLRPHGPVTLRYARLLFLWSSFGGSYEVPYHEKTSKGDFMLDFVDFLEALARLAQLLVLPSERKLLIYFKVKRAEFLPIDYYWLYFRENGAVCNLKEDPTDESPEEPLDMKLTVLLEIIMREFKEQLGANDVPHICAILEMRRREQRKQESQAPNLKFLRMTTLGRGFR